MSDTFDWAALEDEIVRTNADAAQYDIEHGAGRILPGPREGLWSYKDDDPCPWRRARCQCGLEQFRQRPTRCGCIAFHRYDCREWTGEPAPRSDGPSGWMLLIQDELTHLTREQLAGFFTPRRP